MKEIGAVHCYIRINRTSKFRCSNNQVRLASFKDHSKTTFHSMERHRGWAWQTLTVNSTIVLRPFNHNRVPQNDHNSTAFLRNQVASLVDDVRIYATLMLIVSSVSSVDHDYANGRVKRWPPVGLAGGHLARRVAERAVNYWTMKTKLHHFLWSDRLVCR